jgi:hypothetical protein
MLHITLDIFSGRENPSLVIDGAEAMELVAELSRHRNVVTSLDAGHQGLGFRGVVIEPTDDAISAHYDLPEAFRIAGGSSAYEAKAQEIAEKLIRRVLQAPPRDNIAHAAQLEKDLLEMLLTPHRSPYATEGDAHAALQPKGLAQAVTCFIELGRFNPGFWNDPSYISRNNCYNYASNKRTNTFAQPGRGSGHMYTAITCPAVTAAAMSDGLHHRFDCFPDTEKPRWLVALVVGPNYDYHWYRKQQEGFWGHKPGGTAARNYDNNGVIITNPETCARGPYTQFCGYFYVPQSQRIN